MLLLRALLRRRRSPLTVPAAGFFTSSGSNATAPPPLPPLGAEGPRDEPGQEGSLARRVERAASVGAAMRGWMADGRAVHRGHVFHAINRLRRHHLHRTALQYLLKQQAQQQRKLSSSLDHAIGQHPTQQAQQQIIWNGWQKAEWSSVQFSNQRISLVYSA